MGKTARGVLAISSIEADSFAREFVDMRRGDMIEAIATYARIQVVDCDEEYVGLRRGFGDGQRSSKSDEERQNIR